MTRNNVFYKSYAGALVLAAIGVLGVTGDAFGIVEGLPSLNTALGLWLVMATVASLTPLPLPRGGGQITLTPVFDLGALFAFGPGPALWIAALSRVASVSTRGWRPISESLLILSRAVLAVWAAGAVYGTLGGGFGSPSCSTAAACFLAGAAATYTLIRNGLSLLAVALIAHHRPRPSLPRTAAWRVGVHLILMAPFAVLITVTQIRVGVAAVSMCLIPLLFARYAHGMWRDAQKGHLDAVRMLMGAVDAADPFTRGHSSRIAKMSVAVARAFGHTQREIEAIEYAAILHDVGRTAVRREILLKPGRLTEAEAASVREHPGVGRDMLETLRFYEDAAEIVHCHHEQPDGQGYPRGLRSDRIPLGARIIMAVAAFDAMTSDRPYRRGLEPREALEELLGNAGTQFDATVVEVLLDLHADGRLFAEFSAAELDYLAQEGCNSRAMAEFVAGTGRFIEPEQVHRPWWTEPQGSIVPVLEMPPEEVIETTVRSNQNYPLDAIGEWSLMVAAHTDEGCVRDNNEDAYTVFAAENLHGCVMVVADGMGGAAAGEVASRLAVESVEAAFMDGEDEDVAWTLKRSLKAANQRIRDRAKSDASLGGMGTTCTAASVVGRELVVGHVGDTRAYHLRDGVIRQLTQDHTLAEEMRRTVGEEHAGNHGHNVLTRCLGGEARVPVDLCGPVELEAGDVIVLASDGLTGLVDDEEIARMASEEAPREACRALVELAKQRGGPDNVTVQIGVVGKS